MPFTIELMSSERVDVRVCLIVSLAIRALKEVRAWFAFPCFQSRRVHLLVCFATLCELTVMLRFVRPVASYTFGSLDMV